MRKDKYVKEKNGIKGKKNNNSSILSGYNQEQVSSLGGKIVTVNYSKSEFLIITGI